MSPRGQPRQLHTLADIEHQAMAGILQSVDQRLSLTAATGLARRLMRTSLAT